MVKKKALKLLIIFFVFMFMMSIVSRGIYTYRLPRVALTNPKRNSLEHVITGEGMVKENFCDAVVVLSDIRIERVMVKEGETIEEGETLFTLNKEDLKEQIKNLEKEVEKEKLAISDLTANERLDAEKKQKEIDRASQDYQTSVDAANRKQADASQDVAVAEEELDDLPSKGDYIDKALENNLELASMKDKIHSLESELKKLQDEKDGLSEQDLIEKEAEIDNKNAEISSAKAFYDEMKSSIKDSSAETWEQKKETLTDALSRATRDYAQASEDKKSTEIKAGRAIEDAKSPDKQDSTKQVKELTLEEKEEKLKKYTELLNSGTEIKSPKKVVVSKVNVEPGGKTPDFASILYVDMNEKLSFHAVISKEEQKQIKIGDSATLSFHNGNDITENAVVSKMETVEKDTTKYDLEITMNEPIASIGEMGEFTLRNVSENQSMTVPLQAVHSDGLKYYVYVLRSKETILGEELKVERRDIEISDRNDRNAALDNGGLSEEDRIIISSNKEIADGVIVRLQQE